MTAAVEVPTVSARRPLAVLLATGWLGLLVLAAVFADLLPLRDPSTLTGDVHVRPGLRWPEPLGTDQLGRSELSRVVYGIRVSLVVGVGASIVAALAGLGLGVLAGYLRGKVEALIDLVTNSLLAFPPLILLVGLAAVLEPSTPMLVLELALLFTPVFTRVARAATLTVAAREFVTAAESLGAGRLRVIGREILPNVVLPVSSYALVVVAAAMIAEGSLSFLGLGIRPPTPSWGVMVAEARERIREAPHGVFVPALFFLFTVLSFNLVGDWARARARGGRRVA